MEQWTLHAPAGSNWRHSLCRRAGPPMNSVVCKPSSAGRRKYALVPAVGIEPVRVPLIGLRILPSTPPAPVQRLYALKADVTSTDCITVFSLSLSPQLMVRSAAGLPPLRPVRLIFRSTKGDSPQISASAATAKVTGQKTPFSCALAASVKMRRRRPPPKANHRTVVKPCEKWRHAHQWEREDE